MEFWTRWEVIAELWVAGSFACAFAYGWVALEQITEEGMRDDVEPDDTCAPTVNAKRGRS